MTTLIFHGDDQAQSRQNLHQAIAKLKQAQVQIKWLAGDKLSPADLEIELRTQNLFQTEALVIENLLSRPRSKIKQKCLNLLISYQGSKLIFFWDKKALTPTILKSLQPLKPQVKLFKLPTFLFKFLDNFKPGNSKILLTLFHQTLKLTNEQVVFVMLTKRLSQLIQAKTQPQLLKGAPWQKKQLLNQVQTWQLNQLIKLHHQLFKIDYLIKTGQTKLNLVDQLDLLILEL